MVALSESVENCLLKVYSSHGWNYLHSLDVYVGHVWLECERKCGGRIMVLSFLLLTHHIQAPFLY